MMEGPGSECLAQHAIGEDGQTARMTWKETRHR
jgi:hypothetical protein